MPKNANKVNRAAELKEKDEDRKLRNAAAWIKTAGAILSFRFVPQKQAKIKGRRL